MKKHVSMMLLLLVLCFSLAACGSNDIPPPEGVDGEPIQSPTSSSMFNGASTNPEETSTGGEQLPVGDTVDLNGGSVPTTQNPNVPGPGVFDDIPDVVTPSQSDNPEDPAQQKTPREQMISLTDEWGLAIPTVNIELFKLEDGALFEQLAEQFPLSLRYVWGQPKTRMEAADGGYRDIWEIGSEDGSFKGRILVNYDGKDEVRATITGAITEVLVDEKDLTGKLTPAEASGGTALDTLWERMNNPEVTAEAINADLSELTYEEAIIQWGRSDHKADDGAYCWRVGDNFICISFDAEGKYTAYRIENFFTQ